MKLLANENIPKASVLLLRRMGYDITSIAEDYAGISDQLVMEIAIREERTILTFDRDYGELIYRYRYYPPKGVIYLRLNTYRPDEPAKIIHHLLTAEQLDPDNALTVFDGDTIRQRKYK